MLHCLGRGGEKKEPGSKCNIKGETMKKPDVWKQNATMKMIAEHNVSNFTNDPEVKDVIKAFTGLPGNYGGFFETVCSNSFELLISMYTLGRIHGIREERKKWKKNRG